MLHRSFLSLSLLAVCASAAVAAPGDEAPAGKNIPGWGQFIDLDEDCEYHLDEGKLTIEVPGTAHDLSVEQNQMNAPHTFQPVTGDFNLSVRVSGTFKPDQPAVTNRLPYQGAGLLIAQDQKNYIRLERATFVRPNNGESFHYANFEIRVDGQLARFGQASDYALIDGKDTWVGIQRRGNQILGAVSQDGKTWHSLGIQPFAAPPQLWVGVAAVNGSKTPLAPQFSELKLTQAAPRDEER